MRLLVTGAAGFIGSHTCDCLLANGHRVDGADDFRSGRRENLRQTLGRENFRLHEIDLADGNAADRVVAEIRPDAIIHLAALVSVPQSIEHPALNRLLNVEMTRMIAAAASACKVPKIVFASSSAVYGEPAGIPLAETADLRPINPYGAAKLESEAILESWSRASGGAALSLRYFNVYGPRQYPGSPYSGVIARFGQLFREGRPVCVSGDGGQTRDFIHVHDVSRANCLAATNRRRWSGAINICMGRSRSLLDLMAVLRGIFPAAPSPIHGPSRPGDIYHSCGDAARARELLGFQTTIELEAGIASIFREGAKSL